MATLGSLAVTARIEQTRAVSTEFRLNQSCIHPLKQVVLKISRGNSIYSIVSRNQSPASSAGKLQPSTSKHFAGQEVRGRTLHCVRLGSLNVCARVGLAYGLAEFTPAQQKEYQCQES